jgi:hypothetical protein
LVEQLPANCKALVGGYCHSPTRAPSSALAVAPVATGFAVELAQSRTTGPTCTAGTAVTAIAAFGKYLTEYGN